MKLFLIFIIVGLLMFSTVLFLMNRNAIKVMNVIKKSDCSDSAHIELYPGDGKEWKCVNGDWKIVDKI